MKARFSQAFGQVVQRERRASGLSQEKFAEIVDAHRNYIGLLERGECGISLDFAEELARALNRPLNELIRDALERWDAVPPRARQRRRSRKRS